MKEGNKHQANVVLKDTNILQWNVKDTGGVKLTTKHPTSSLYKIHSVPFLYYTQVQKQQLVRRL